MEFAYSKISIIVCELQKFLAMNYNIKAIFLAEKTALTCSKILKSAGFTKIFTGFTSNSNIHPQSLVEDHFVEENNVVVYTPNLNRAYKARNILLALGAEIIDDSGLSSKNFNNSENTISRFAKKLKQYDSHRLIEYKIKN